MEITGRQVSNQQMNKISRTGAVQQRNGLSCEVMKLQLLELRKQRLNGHLSEMKTDFKTDVKATWTDWSYSVLSP